MAESKLLQVEREGSIAVLRIVAEVGSLSDTRVLADLQPVQAELASIDARQLIVDLNWAPYFGSSLLEALRVVWMDIQARGGRMVVCNVAPVGREILEIAKFDRIWPIYDDRASAVRALSEPLPG